MKWTVLLVILSFGLSATAQRDLTPSSRKKAFGGAQSFKNYNLYGIQFQLGGTFLMNRLNNPTLDATQTTHGFRGNYTHDPYGKLGAYAEIGMFHFPKKRSALSKKLKFIFVSYYDWGLGFKYFRGGEKLTTNFIDVGGNQTSSNEDKFDFSGGHVYGRFTLHKNIHFHPKGREKLNFFLDNSLGINFDYRVFNTSDDYVNGYSAQTSGALYAKPLQVQLHYGLGFGFSPRRGMFIIPGVRVPLLGYQTTVPTVGQTGSGDASIGKPSTNWFSSRYWPLLFHVKFMFALPKKQKGCATGITNDQDQDTQRGR